MDKYKKLLSNTMIFAIGIGLSKIIISLMLPIYTRTLTEAELGNAELLLNISKLAVPICSFSISSAVLRFGLSDEASKEDIFKTTMCFLSLSVVVLFAFTKLTARVDVINDYGPLFFMITLLSVLRMVLCSHIKASEKNIIFSIDSIIYNLLLSAFSVYFLIFRKMGMIGYLIPFVISGSFSVLFLLLSGRVMSCITTGKFRKELMTKMIRYSFPLVFTDISWALISVTDKYMITYRLSDSKNGIYSVAAKFPMIITMMIEVFSGAWLISTVQENDKKERSGFYLNIFYVLHLSLCIIILLMFTFNSTLILWIIGEKFSESVYYIPVLLFGSLFSGYSAYYSSLLSADKKTGHIMKSTLIGVSINIILNWALIPSLGVLGACLATVISSFAISSYRMIVYRVNKELTFDLLRWILSIAVVLSAMIVSVRIPDLCFVSVFGVFVLLALYRSYISEVINDFRKTIK